MVLNSSNNVQMEFFFIFDSQLDLNNNDLFFVSQKGSVRIRNDNPERGFVEDSFADTDDYCAWKPAQPLPEAISSPVDCTPQDAILKEELRDSMSDARLSSGSSNLSSQMTDYDSEQQDLTRSMMAFLLPQAIPLLKKTYCRKSSRKKIRGNKERIGSDLATKEKDGGNLNKVVLKMLAVIIISRNIHDFWYMWKSPLFSDKE